MTKSAYKRWRGRLTVLLALGVVTAVMTWGVISRRAELADAPRFDGAPVAVRTVTAETGQLERTRRYLAEAEAARTASVAARITERVTEVPVDEGDRVDAGDTLARLNTSGIDARLEGAAADLEQAQAERNAQKANRAALADSAAYWTRELERLQRLRDRNAASESDVDEAADRLNVVEGNLAAANAQLEALGARIKSLRARQRELHSQRADYTLQSPFNGVVTERTVDPGDQAAPGRTLVQVSTTDRMRLSFGVPRTDRSAVAAGQAVHFPLEDRDWRASITRIHPALDTSRLARAEVDLPPGIPLPPGAAVRLTVELPRLEDAILIPEDALAGSEEGPTVYVVEDGKARARPVTVQGRTDGRVAVSGIEPGADLITTPYLGWTRLADGMAVTLAASP